MRFYGNVGYGESVESPSDSGIWVMGITEQPYYGDVLRNTRKLENGDGLNKDIVVSNSISILADDHAVKHFHLIKYVVWEGVRWEVSSVDASQRPRLILSLGSVYNGPIPEEEEEP
jgi:hypothetical protein